MEEKVIKSIPAVPLALMIGAISAVIALIVAVIFVPFWLYFTNLAYTSLPLETYSWGTGLFLGMGGFVIIIIPIGSFVVGFIQGLIVAVVYNFLAPRIGGIKVRLQDTRPMQ
jgi:hypothetical protein